MPLDCSIAPSIYGWRNIKTALALSMFGGEAKQQPKKKVLESRSHLSCDVSGMLKCWHQYWPYMIDHERYQAQLYVAPRVY